VKLRVYTEKGKIVMLVDFEYRVDHINLLVTMQRLIPNLTLPARDSKGMPCGVKVFQLVLERKLLTLLNPAA